MERNDVINGLNASYAQLQTYLDPTDCADILGKIRDTQGDPTTEEVVELIYEMLEAVQNDPPVDDGRGGRVMPDSYADSVIAQEYLSKYRDPSYQTIWEFHGIA